MSHEDFKIMGDAEFRERYPPQLDETIRQPSKRSAQQEANAIARQAATLCWRIRHEEPDPKKWGPLIAAAPEEVRECLRAYLVQAYAELQHKARGKQSATAEAELAKMAEHVRRM